MSKRSIILVIWICFLAVVSTERTIAQTTLPQLGAQHENIVTKEMTDLADAAESAFYANQMQVADSLASTLLNRSEKLNSRFFKARALLIFGLTHKADNKNNKAFDYFYSSAELFDALKNNQYLAKAELELGEMYIEVKSYQNAYLLLADADSLYGDEQFKIENLRLYKNCGIASLNVEKFNDALNYFLLYRKKAIIHQQWENQVEALEYLAITYRTTKDYFSAVQFDLELVKILKQLKSSNFAKALLSLADDQYMNNDIALAQTNYLTIIDQSKDADILIPAYLGLANIYQKQNHAEDVERYMLKSIALTSHPEKKIEILNLLTNYYLSVNQIDKAKESNAKAISLLRGDSPTIELKVYSIAQQIALLKKDFKEASHFSDLTKNLKDIVSEKLLQTEKEYANLLQNISFTPFDLKLQNLIAHQSRNKQEVHHAIEPQVPINATLKSPNLPNSKKTKDIKSETRSQIIELERIKKLYQNEIENSKKAIKEKQVADLNWDKVQDSLKILKTENLKLKQALLKEQAMASSSKFDRPELLIMVVLSLILIVIAVLYVFKMRRNKQKTDALNQAIEHEKYKLKESLIQLQATQSQLVELSRLAISEKQTIEIIHEIKNQLHIVDTLAKQNQAFTIALENMVFLRNKKMDSFTLNDFMETSKRIQENSIKMTEKNKNIMQIIAEFTEMNSQ